MIGVCRGGVILVPQGAIPSTGALGTLYLIGVTTAERY